MARMSQKEVLDEGIGSILKKTAQAATGAVGAVGGALKAVSDAGINATWTDAAKGGVEGAKKGWKMFGGDATLKNLNKALARVALIATDKPRGNIKKQAAVPVAKLDYDSNTGKPIAGEKHQHPAIITFEKGEFRVIKAPGVRVGHDQQQSQQQKKQQKKQQPTPTPTPTPAPGVVTSSFSQKNLLRRLHILRS